MKRIILLFAVLVMNLPGFCRGEIKVQMVLVVGGSFYMGKDDPYFHKPEFDNERPVHRVNMSSYYMGKYEITQGQWKEVMGIYPPAYNGVNYGNKDCDDCPVVKVNYDEIQDFIYRLNERCPGKNYRLPTEAEWEYAARGGKYGKDYNYAGSDKLSDVAWSGKRNGTTHPVGQKKPNEIGIYDMSGNVEEWCTDWYSADYYGKTVDELDPTGPLHGVQRVVRGGSFFDDDLVCRTVNRARFDPNVRQWNIGFRLAMDSVAVVTPKPKTKAKPAVDTTEGEK